MYKLKEIYNEIKILSPNNYPKNKNWMITCNKRSEFVTLMRELESLGFNYKNKKPTEETMPNHVPIDIIHREEDPGIIFWRIKKINEIKILPNLKPSMLVKLDNLIPPDENDTIKSWLKKNGSDIAYSEGRKSRYYSVKPNRNLIKFDYDKLASFYPVWVNRGDGIYEKSSNYEQNQELTKKILRETAKYTASYIQNFLDEYCGKDRIKVKGIVLDRPWGINVRFFIPQKSREFKMIQ